MANIKINSGTGKPATINKPGRPGVGINRHDYKSYLFDGVDDYISIPQTTLNFGHTDPQSYEIWFKLNSLVGDEKGLFSMFHSSGRGTKIYVNSDRYINFIMRRGSVRYWIRSQDNGLNQYINQILVQDRWYHLVVTFNGVDATTGMNFYVDGKLISKTVVSNTLNITPLNEPTVYLGGGNGTVPSNSEIALCRVFSKALSQEEITTLYNNGQPLINTSISNKVFEIIPNTVLKDTANNVNGTVSGAILKSSDVNAIVRNGNQNFSGNKLYYNTYGLAGEADANTVIDSPFTDARTCAYYDSVTNKTFIAWQQRPYLGGNRQSMVMAVDHTGKYATPSYQAGYESPGGIDNHGAPSLIVTPAGDVLVVHEDQHDTPIYCRRTTGKNLSTAQLVFTVPEAQSYPALAKIGTDIFMFSRGAGANRDVITKSTDGGTTWGPTQLVLRTETVAPNLLRPYFKIVYHPTKLIYFINLRDEIPGIYPKMCYIESTDGVTFRNINNSFSKNIVSSGNITRAELDANFSVMGEIGGTDIFLKCAFWTANGIIGYTNHETNNYQFFYWSGSAWITKPLPLPIYQPTQAGGNSGRIDTWCPYSYNLDHHVIYRIEPRNGYNVIVCYETFDRWDTWDAGTIISDIDKNHDQLCFTYNINDAPKVLVAAGQLTGNSNFDNNIFLYEFTP